MRLEERTKHDVTIIDIIGQIDRLKDSIVLKSFINNLLDKGVDRLAINLSNVTYLDSGALNVVIYCNNALHKKDGSLVLIEPNEYVKDVLEVVGLHKLVTIYQKEEDFDQDMSTR
jgi:stage II sporulation protein AA (anti-sigma F factor antagonist)